MKKLLSIFTAISILATPVTWVAGCSPVLDLPYISNNKISENTKKAINDAVLSNKKDAKIKSLFDYNLDEWSNPNFKPVKNIMTVKLNSNDLFNQTHQYLTMQQKMNNNVAIKKDTLEYMQKSLLSSRDMISQPWPTVVEKYNWYLDQKSKNQSVIDLSQLTSYFDGSPWNEALIDKKRWLYVDQVRSNNPNDWFKDAHAWSLNPKSIRYNEKTKFDQGIFYHILLNTFLKEVNNEYNVKLRAIWNENDSQYIVSPDIAGITFAFTTWDPNKWTKHFVDGHPIVESNANIFENLPILPIEQTIGVKLIVADIYGTISSYLIGNFVISNLLGLDSSS
ncbi:hypothetical protein S100390_v1c06300 [Spiroplasma sp. NBRC 100390]|uniref:lipoprotein n=1 Tax=unclassified Spiroplasma TaxID=2637901 RepID=UPI00089299D1|nr:MULTISPECIES: lipoprotein [unclassified Spiroplasma]AOX43967.1 hypothetical protein STU14_v1c06300 [Spiroplasma sp. TU-14]APE13437.1 hypothetical protein S100390_v1c06300 [Spiroplasma sp. NBRC 100390]